MTLGAPKNRPRGGPGDGPEGPTTVVGGPETETEDTSGAQEDRVSVEEPVVGRTVREVTVGPEVGPGRSVDLATASAETWEAEEAAVPAVTEDEDTKAPEAAVTAEVTPPGLGCRQTRRPVAVERTVTSTTDVGTEVARLGVPRDRVGPGAESRTSTEDGRPDVHPTEVAPSTEVDATL